MPNLSRVEMPDGTILDIPGTTYNVVSKTANGLCPQLPNETTTRKYLRQDGTWVQPPNTTTGTTYAAGSAPGNTTFGTNGSIKNVYDKVLTLGAYIEGSKFSGRLSVNPCPLYLTVPAGTWFIFTSGYSYNSTTVQIMPLGLGTSTGWDVRALQPSMVVTLSQQTNYYIWNLVDAALDCADLQVKAIRIGV